MGRQKQRNTSHNFLSTPPLLPPPPHVLPEQEEFDESDVVWSDNNRHHDDNTDNDSTTTTIISNTAVPTTVHSLSSPRFTAGISAALLAENQPRSPTSIQRKMTSSPVAMISSSYLANRGGGGGPGFGSSRYHMSAPVNVPVWPENRPKFGGWLVNEDDGGDWLRDDGEEVVPPHEIVARSHNTTAFSVMEGVGRTLKGRDLTKVRNAVFQKTGFID